MTDIDHVLRTAIATHVAHAQPSPLLLGSVRRRVRRTRRNQAAASLSVLALVAAGAVALTPTWPPGGAETGPRLAAEGASLGSPTSGATALDPKAPWPYRGDPLLRDDTVLDALRSRLAGLQALSDGDVLSPLFGRAEASGQPAVLVYVTTSADGAGGWGHALVRDGVVGVVSHSRLAAGTVALAAAVPGGSGDDLLVVTGSHGVRVEYAADEARRWTPMPSLAQGVAVTDLAEGVTTDRYRVLSEQGSVLHEAAAPDPTGPPRTAPQTPGPTQPPADARPSRTAEPDPAPAAGPSAFDPARPWPFRGDAAVRAAVATRVWDAWLARNGQGERGSSDASALWAGTVDRTGRKAVVLIARQTDRTPWHVVVGQDAPDGGVELLEARRLEGSHLVLDAVLPGGEVPVLLGLTDPATQLRWSPTGEPGDQRTDGGSERGVAAFDTGVDTRSRWYVHTDDGVARAERLDAGSGSDCAEGPGTC